MTNIHTLDQPTSEDPTQGTTVRLRAAWSVSAGLIPGILMPELSKEFYYTEHQNEKDNHVPDHESTLFMKTMREAHEYAQAISDPASLNWVKVEFTWL